VRKLVSTTWTGWQVVPQIRGHELRGGAGGRRPHRRAGKSPSQEKFVFGWDSANQFFSDCVNPDINKSDTRPVLLAYKIGNFLTYQTF
jgi:hypothetical protein